MGNNMLEEPEVEKLEWKKISRKQRDLRVALMKDVVECSRELTAAHTARDTKVMAIWIRHVRQAVEKLEKHELRFGYIYIEG